MRTFQSFHAAAVDGYLSHLRREQRKHFVRFANIDLAKYNAFTVDIIQKPPSEILALKAHIAYSHFGSAPIFLYFYPQIKEHFYAEERFKILSCHFADAFERRAAFAYYYRLMGCSFTEYFGADGKQL